MSELNKVIEDLGESFEDFSAKHSKRVDQLETQLARRF